MIYRHTTNLLLIIIVLGFVEGNVFVEETAASYTAIVAKLVSIFLTFPEIYPKLNVSFKYRRSLYQNICCLKHGQTFYRGIITE